jgi:hypothetical protein
VVSPPVVITIPRMPPRECSPNYRGHWSVLARARAEFRETAFYTMWNLPGVDKEWLFLRYGQPMALDIAVAWCCGRKRMDADNLVAACKGAIDGIADAVWSGDDSHVTIGTVTQTRGEGVTILTVREVVA